MDMQVQEGQRVPNKMNPKRSTPRHIIIKMPKVKHQKKKKKRERERERENLKSSKSKAVTYQGAPCHLIFQ